MKTSPTFNQITDQIGAAYAVEMDEATQLPAVGFGDVELAPGEGHHLLSSEEGSAKAWLLGAIGAAAAGVTAVLIWHGGGGSAPKVAVENHVKQEPSEVAYTFNMNRGCYFGFDTDTGTKIIAEPHFKSGNIPGVNTHLGWDIHIGFYDIWTKINGTVETQVCQKEANVTAIYTPASNSLVVDVPRNAITFDAHMLAEGRRVDHGHGRGIALTKSVADLQTLITSKGLPNKITDVNSAQEDIAQELAEGKVVEQCATEVSTKYQQAFADANKANWSYASKVFGKQVPVENIQFEFVGDETPQYDNEVKYSESDVTSHNMKVEFDGGGKCVDKSAAPTNIDGQRAAPSPTTSPNAASETALSEQGPAVTPVRPAEVPTPAPTTLAKLGN
ncbi:MAG: hypothetical protein JWN38_307 [Candidatus Saccharibacteria bacterium]|nr:hypothetical protein [Candidatus Saccharibacteria bacterium]